MIYSHSWIIFVIAGRPLDTTSLLLRLRGADRRNGGGGISGDSTGESPVTGRDATAVCLCFDDGGGRNQLDGGEQHQQQNPIRRRGSGQRFFRLEQRRRDRRGTISISRTAAAAGAR